MNVLAVLSAGGWLLEELFLFCRKLNHGAEFAKLDPHLVVPSSLDIMLEGMLDAICFVVGCMLLLLAASTFLHKFGTANNPADSLLLCYPLLFGPAALIRIFLCNSRRLLYHSLFEQGVILDFNNTKTSRDLLLVYTYMGFAVAVGVLLFDSAQSAQEGSMSWKAMAINTVIFTSPLYYMVSSLLNSLRLELEAINCMCLQRLDTSELDHSAHDRVDRLPPSPQLTQLTQLTPIAEGHFCRTARKESRSREIKDVIRISIDIAKKTRSSHHSVSQPDADMDYFRLTDMFWVPRLVSGKSKSAILLVTSMPILALLAMLLGLVSLAWLIKHRTDAPEIEVLRADVPGLTPNFDYEITDYTLAYPRTQSGVTFSVYAGTDRTGFINASVMDGSTPVGDPQVSTSGSLTYHVQLTGQKFYPTVVEFKAGTHSQVRNYRITAIQSEVIIRSVFLHGITTSGSKYRRCIRWKEIVHGAISIPETLTDMQMDFALQEFHWGLPFNESLDGHFVPVFKRPEDVLNVRQQAVGCGTWCRLHPECWGLKEADNGCYFVIGPSPSSTSCEDLHAAKASEPPHLGVSVSVCSIDDPGHCAPTTLSGHVVSANINGLTTLASTENRLLVQTSLDLGAATYVGEKYEVRLHRGLLPLREVFQSWGGTGRMNKTVLSDGTYYFRSSLTLRKRLKGGQKSSAIIAVVIDDADIQMQWDTRDGETRLLDMSKVLVWMRKPCAQPTYLDFGMCGGYRDSFNAEAMVKPWTTKHTLRGMLVSKSHPSLFRPKKVQVDFVYGDGTISPLQAAIQGNCAEAPICRGNEIELDKCLANAKKHNCLDLCKERCISATMDPCEEARDGPVMEQIGRLAVVAKDRLPEHLAKMHEFFDWFNVQIWDEYEVYITDDVLVDIAERCTFRSGMLSLVRQRRHNMTSVAWGRIFEALVRNPAFSFNHSFGKIPVLRALFDDRPQDFVWDFGLSTVAVHKPSLQALTLPVCLASNPTSINFVNPDLIATLVERLRVATKFGKSAKEVEDAEGVLHQVSTCLRAKGKRFRPFSAEECRSRASTNTLNDGSKPSFFSLAPSQRAFIDLLPVCQTGTWMEYDGRTVAHVAAEKAFSSALTQVLKAKYASVIRPSVNATYMGLLIMDHRDIAVRFEGRSALHDACTFRCPGCVEPLLRFHAQMDAEMNLTIFPKDWDIVNHPWMLRFLGSYNGTRCQDYKAMWLVQPLHLAATHNCSGCLKALVAVAGKAQLDSTMNLGTLETCFAKDTSPPTAKHSGSQTGNRYSGYSIVHSYKNDDSCQFRALDLAVLFDCRPCVEILRNAGASSSDIMLDQNTSHEYFPALKLLPKDLTVRRCRYLNMQSKSSARAMLQWV